MMYHRAIATLLSRGIDYMTEKHASILVTTVLKELLCIVNGAQDKEEILVDTLEHDDDEQDNNNNRTRDSSSINNTSKIVKRRCQMIKKIVLHPWRK